MAAVKVSRSARGRWDVHVNGHWMVSLLSWEAAMRWACDWLRQMADLRSLLQGDSR